MICRTWNRTSDTTATNAHLELDVEQAFIVSAIVGVLGRGRVAHVTSIPDTNVEEQSTLNVFLANIGFQSPPFLFGFVPVAVVALRALDGTILIISESPLPTGGEEPFTLANDFLGETSALLTEDPWLAAAVVAAGAFVGHTLKSE